MHVHSFPPIARTDAWKLILGSMPGRASLAANRYYAHPRNSFWRIVGALLSFPPDAPYAQRCVKIVGAGIALWDVLKTCTRSGSLDASIVASSMASNDFPAFFREHPEIGIIFFNGAKAESIYMRHVRPGLPDDLAAIPSRRLPSTSPANASLSFSAKLARWKAIRD